MHLLDATMLYAPASGGVARYLHEKHKWLRRHARIRHTFLVPGPRTGAGASGESYLRTWSIPSLAYRWPAGGPRWTRAICAARPDLIEIGDPGPVGWAAFRAAQALDIPLIAFCHSDVVRVATERMGAAAAAALRHCIRVLYRRCDLVVAPSEYMRMRLAQWGIDRVILRPLGVDLATFTPAVRSTTLRDEIGLTRSTRLLAYAGRFAPEKNLDVILESFKKLGAPYHLIIAGSGAQMPTLPNVTVLPFLHSSAALAELLASADGLVHAGDQETFGLILLEAMACGRGVIAPRSGAAPELVSPGTGVLVAPRDADALVEGIKAFYAQDIEAMGRCARAQAEANYGWDTAMRGMLGLYRGALRSATTETAGYATY
jgi:alpha-1,6-mannosyltransferase